MVTDLIKLNNPEGKTNYQLLRDGISQYVVRPANAFGLGGFLFDIEGDSTVTQTSEITDNFVEDNSAVQDHIAVRPLEVTLNNYVGELVREDENDGVQREVQKAVQKLTVLDAYLPNLATAANQVKSIIEGDQSIANSENINTALDLFSLVKNLNPTASRQQQAYLYFKALQQQKILVSVQTPFEFLTNMAIETLTATQGEDSRFISNFSITLKQIRTASTQVAAFDASKFATKAGQQRGPLENKGKAQGEDQSLTISILEGIFK